MYAMLELAPFLLACLLVAIYRLLAYLGNSQCEMQAEGLVSLARPALAGHFGKVDEKATPMEKASFKLYATGSEEFHFGSVVISVED
jgi:hypothetical protein